MLITDHKKGRMFDFNKPWRFVGKPQIMNDEDVECFTESVCKNPGEKNMKEYVNEMLIDEKIWLKVEYAFQASHRGEN
jgi:hypothetical protein